MKLKFFLGSPDEITKEFQEWQKETSPKITGMQQSLAAVPLPRVDSNPIVPTGQRPALSIEIQTMICLLVMYEDMPDQSTKPVPD